MAHVRRLPSKKWNAVVRLPSGRKVSYTHPLRKVVEQWARDREDERDRGIVRDPKAGRVTLADWAERWFAARVVDATTRDKDEGVYGRYVKPEWGSWPLESIAGTDVQAWVRRLSERGLAAATVQGAYQQLSAMLAAAVRDRVILSSPCVSIRLPRVVPAAPVFYSDAELAAVVGAMVEPYATMADLQGWVGLRYGEAAGLHAHRVDWLRGRLHVVDVMTKRGLREYPKSRKSRREVPVEPSTLERMARLMEGRPREGLVFLGAGGGPVPYQTWYWHWQAAVAAAGVAYHRPHVLRHTAASRLVMAGVDLYRVQAVLGHESFATTQQYAHLAPGYHDAVTEAWGRARPTSGPPVSGSGSGPPP